VSSTGPLALSSVVDEMLQSLSFDLTCEQMLSETGEACGAEAYAALACRFCPFAFFVCADHLRRWREAAEGRSYVRCTRCDARAATLDKLVRITPVHS
jgi:hypothetical protein